MCTPLPPIVTTIDPPLPPPPKNVSVHDNDIPFPVNFPSTIRLASSKTHYNRCSRTRQKQKSIIIRHPPPPPHRISPSHSQKTFPENKNNNKRCRHVRRPPTCQPPSLGTSVIRKIYIKAFLVQGETPATSCCQPWFALFAGGTHTTKQPLLSLHVAHKKTRRPLLRRRFTSPPPAPPCSLFLNQPNQNTHKLAGLLPHPPFVL